MEREHHLHQRLPAEVALQPELVDQKLERDVRMVVGRQRRAAHPLQELAEGRIAAAIAAQGEQVDKEADEPFDLGLVAVGHGRAHGHVPLSGDAVEERLPGREERHEQGRTPGAGQVTQGAGEGRGHGQADRLAPERLHRRPRPVGGNLEVLQSGQTAGPPLELSGQYFLRP